MEIKIIANNLGDEARFVLDRGLSCLVDGHILFDTSESGQTLKKNLAAAQVDLAKITALVLSHDHPEHSGGVKTLLNLRPNLAVYLGAHFDAAIKEDIKNAGGRIVENRGLSEIAPGVYLTGEILCVYKQAELAEQALVLRTAKGLAVLTGCAHPGIIKIIDVVRERFPEDPLTMVLGGFHLVMEQEHVIELVIKTLQDSGVARVVPTHCTGEKAMQKFRAAYGHNFLSGEIGKVFHV